MRGIPWCAIVALFLLVPGPASGGDDAKAKAEAEAEAQAAQDAMLIRHLDAHASKERDTAYRALKNLVTKAPASLDLRDWALRHVTNPPPPPDKPKTIDGPRAMVRLETGWTKEHSEKRTVALASVALGGPTAFDLRAWARTCIGKRYPIKAREMDRFLEEKRWRQVLFALTHRNPSGGLLKKAAKSERFGAWCTREAKKRRALARKGIMARRYMFSGDAVPKDNLAFSRDLGIKTWVEVKNEETGKWEFAGFYLEDEKVLKHEFPAYIERQLSTVVLMESIAAGKPLKPSAITKRVKQEDAKILAALKRRYG